MDDLEWDDDAFPATCNESAGCLINPATGLPMVGGCGGVDVGGNPFGTDLHRQDTFIPAPDIPSFDDPFGA